MGCLSKLIVYNKDRLMKKADPHFIICICARMDVQYLIGQNFVGQNFRWTKYFVGQNFRHQAEISTVLSDFCLTFVLKYWTKFSTDKISSDKIFDGQNISSDKIFDTKPKFRQFCPIFT